MASKRKTENRKPRAANPPKPAKGTPQAPDIGALAGINALAARHGTDPDAVLALLGMLLCGTAGSEAWLGNLAAGAPLAKLDLLLREEDRVLRRALDDLVARLRVVDRALSASMGRFSPEIGVGHVEGGFCGRHLGQTRLARGYGASAGAPPRGSGWEWKREW